MEPQDLKYVARDMTRNLSAVLVAPDATTGPRGAAIVRNSRTTPSSDSHRTRPYRARARSGRVRDMRHRIYKLLRQPDWSLEISGIFVEVAEEAENDLSYCKLS